jgi:hypothetical protein
MNPLNPLQIKFFNASMQTPSEISVSLPKTDVASFVTVSWGDGSTSQLYGGVGNRLVHSYGNPTQKGGYTVCVTGDAQIVSFYDASGDRPKGVFIGWGDYAIMTLIMPDNSVMTNPSTVALP